MRRVAAFAVNIVAACILGRSGPANGAVIAADDFSSYTPGTSLSGDAGGSGWGANAWTLGSPTAAPYTVASDALSYSSGSVAESSVNSAKMTLPGTNAASANYPTALVRQLGTTQSATNVYFSVLFKPLSINSGNDYFAFELNNNSSGEAAGSGAFGQRNAASNPFFSRVVGGTTVTGPLTSTLSTAGTTYLLVGEFAISGGSGADYDTLNLWVNPTSTVQGSNTVSSTAFVDSTKTSISDFSMRLSPQAANETSSFEFSDLVIGTTFADVVVPEPSSLAVMALLTGLLMFRRATPIR